MSEDSYKIPTRTTRRSFGNPLRRKEQNAISNEQLSALYANCIKLCSQNKVTPQNAWNLDLIDYITDVIRPGTNFAQSETETDAISGNESKTGTDFTRATATLDASVQIYSCRVDSVHTSAYKILGGLSSAQDTNDNVENNEVEEQIEKNNEEEQFEHEEKTKTKTKKVPTFVITLEQNEENINLKKSENVYKLDPGFKEVSAIFNNGGARGLLLNYLKIDNVGKLLFDNSDANQNCYTDANPQEYIEDKELFDYGFDHCSFLKTDNFCDTLSQFTADGIPLKGTAMAELQNESMLMEIEHVDIGKLIAEQNMNMSEINEEQQNDQPFFQNSFEADGIDGIDEDELADQNDKPSKLNLRRSLARCDEYNYFDPQLSARWDGPKHWKYQLARAKTKTKENDEEDEIAKGKKAKKSNFIDFSKPEKDKLQELFAAPVRGSTLLSTTALRKQTTLSTTLPPDEHYELRMLSSLFTKPNWTVDRLKKRQRENEIASQTNSNTIDYGNNLLDNDEDVVDPSGDGFDFSAMLGLDELKAKEEQEEQEKENEEQKPAEKLNDEDQQTYTETQVTTTFKPEQKEQKAPPINYAKIAKSIDVSLLKEGIWRAICSKPDNPNCRTFSPGSSTHFQTVLDALASILPRSMIGELSIAMCYICLLHLCNEKGLAVESKDKLSDLVISMPEKRTSATKRTSTEKRMSAEKRISSSKK